MELIQRDDPFPQKKMGCGDNGRIAAIDPGAIHRAAFRFKWENGRERFCRGMDRRRRRPWEETVGGGGGGKLTIPLLDKINEAGVFVGLVAT